MSFPLKESRIGKNLYRVKDIVKEYSRKDFVKERQIEIDDLYLDKLGGII